MLAYKKVDYDVVEVNPLNKKELAFSENYRKVPIFINARGEQVNDSNVILQHIDTEYPGVPVFSKDPAAKARDEQWLAWSEKYVQGLPTVIYDKLGDSIKAFDYITKTGKFSWLQSRMIKYSGAFVMTMVAKKIRKRENIENPEAFLEAKTAEWVAGLSGRPFMGGERPGAADIAVFGISRAVGSLNAGPVFQKNPAFWAWLQRMQTQTGLTLSVV